MKTNQSDETEEKSSSIEVPNKSTIWITKDLEEKEAKELGLIKEAGMYVPYNPEKEEEERMQIIARLRLEKEVEELKKREDQLLRKPSDTMEKIMELRNAQENIICIADVFKEVAKDWEEKSKKVEKFATKLWEKVDASHRPAGCVIHSCELPLDRDATFSASWKEQKVRIVYDKCPMCEAESKSILVNEKWKKMGIPNKLLHARFITFDADTDEQRRALMKVSRHRNDGFVIIRGSVGTGKSHLAAAWIKEMGEGLFITQADLIGELRQTYSDNTGQDSMIDKYRKTKVLVLDELSKEVRGTDIPALLYRILSYRYDKNLLTVITSNERLEDILDILGEKLTDRIRDNNTVVTCEWSSFRGKNETN